jgi:hypothetical protein
VIGWLINESFGGSDLSCCAHVSYCFGPVFTIVHHAGRPLRPPLGDDPEAYFSAGQWELLVNLHKSGWQVVVCTGRPSLGYSIEVPACPKHVCLRRQKGRSAPALSRAYLILLSTSEMLGFKSEIPHMGTDAHYSALLDCAFPHHSQEARGKKRCVLADLDGRADVLAFLAFLDDLPDPADPAPALAAPPAAPPIPDDVQSSSQSEPRSNDDPGEFDGDGGEQDEDDYDSDIDGDEGPGGSPAGSDDGDSGGGNGGEGSDSHQNPLLPSKCNESSFVGVDGSAFHRTGG